MSAETYRAAVARAAELAGGVQALSDQLRIPVKDLMAWMRGEAKPSPGTFLRLVDYLVKEAGELAAGRGGSVPRGRRPV